MIGAELLSSACEVNLSQVQFILHLTVVASGRYKRDRASICFVRQNSCLKAKT